MHVTGVHHIALHTADVARLRDFYVDILGLPLAGGFAGYPILFVQAGNTLIELIGDKQPGEPRGQGWNHVALEVADIDAAVAALEARGVHFHVRPKEFPPAAPSLRIAFCRDPDGNELELVQQIT